MLTTGYGGPYLQTQQTSLETQHNIFETQHKIIETQHNIIQTQHKIVETQHNIIQTQHNIIETEHNIIQTQHKIIETQHKIIETQSSMQNWYAIIQRTILSLVNRWHVMRQTKSPRIKYGYVPYKMLGLHRGAWPYSVILLFLKKYHAMENEIHCV